MKFTIILSMFETLDWANKREYKNFVLVALQHQAQDTKHSVK